MRKKIKQLPKRIKDLLPMAPVKLEIDFENRNSEEFSKLHGLLNPCGDKIICTMFESNEVVIFEDIYLEDGLGRLQSKKYSHPLLQERWSLSLWFEFDGDDVNIFN